MTNKKNRYLKDRVQPKLDYRSMRDFISKHDRSREQSIHSELRTAVLIE